MPPVKRAHERQQVQHTIEPTTAYSIEAATAALGLRKTALVREMRQGRLRYAKRCDRRWLLGEWLLEWLRAGEVRRAAKEEAC